MSDLADRVDAMAERAKARRREQRQAQALADDRRQEELAQKRDEFRQCMPEVADVVDQFRAVFGEDVRVLAAAENGRVVVNRRGCERVGVNWRRYAIQER